MRAVLLPLFDSQELAKRSLGIHWRNRTEDEKQEFVQLFTELVEQSYSHTLDRYTTDVQFFFDHERIEGDFAEYSTLSKPAAWVLGVLWVPRRNRAVPAL